MFSQKTSCLKSAITIKRKIAIFCLVLTGLYIPDCHKKFLSFNKYSFYTLQHIDHQEHYNLIVGSYFAIWPIVKNADNKTEIPGQEKINHQNLKKESKKYRGWIIGLVILSVSGTIFSIRQIELSRYKTRQKMKLLEVETKKLKELDQLRSRFFANISHEFRTPLTLIMGPLEQLLEENKTGKNVQKKLYVMHSNTQKLKILINQLLDLSKIESGSYPLKASRGNLTSFLKALTVSFASQAEQKNIKLELKLDPFLKTRKFRDQFYFDRDIFEKIIINLLSNAFKFTPEHGKIEIRACILQENGNKSILEIRIKDNGPGISEQKLPYIFDRFFQADEVLIRDYEGSGIGLAFVKELTTLHYGHILAKSEPSRGTVFILQFPVGMAHFKDGEIIDEDNKASFQSNKVRKTFPSLLLTTESNINESNSDWPVVLVVDDHKEMRWYLNEILQSRFRVVEAKGAVEGVKLAQKLIPELIISDVMMPEMNGYEFCEIIKNNDLTSHIPLIFLTARGDEKDRLKGLEIKADDYLLKPFNPNELLIRVENLIENRRMLREKFNNKTILKTSDIVVSSRDQVLMQKLINAVEANVHKAEFSIGELGKEVGMSRSQLHRKMNALINQTPNNFIQSARMNKAKEMLEKDAGTIAEIAFMVGYDDPGYFSKSFRRFFGMLPSEIRKINK